MKYLGIVVIVLALVGLNGCSSTPSKLERIEANEAAIAVNQEAILDIETRPVDTSCPAACVESIDRAFKKSMQK